MSVSKPDCLLLPKVPVPSLKCSAFRQDGVHPHIDDPNKDLSQRFEIQLCAVHYDCINVDTNTNTVK